MITKCKHTNIFYQIRTNFVYLVKVIFGRSNRPQSRVRVPLMIASLCLILSSCGPASVYPSDERAFISLLNADASQVEELRIYPDDVLVTITRVGGAKHPKRTGVKLRDGAYAAAFDYWNTHKVQTPNGRDAQCPGANNMHVFYEIDGDAELAASTCGHAALAHLYRNLRKLIMSYQRGYQNNV